MLYECDEFEDELSDGHGIMTASSWRVEIDDDCVSEESGEDWMSRDM